MFKTLRVFPGMTVLLLAFASPAAGPQRPFEGTVLGEHVTCDPGSPGSECFGEEQVYLIDRNGNWEVLAQGTGIECWDEHMRDPAPAG